MLLEKTLGWHDEKIADHYWLTLLFMPFAISMYILEIREKRRRIFKHQMTWKQGFISGLLMAIFIALLSPIAQYITHNYITPKYFETVKNYSVTNDLMTIEAANEYFNLTNYLWQSLLGGLIGGAIISAIAALFLMKNVK
jgi:glucan phosphoethanolaminetransferase (alkaline phosphatase superfamily)